MAERRGRGPGAMAPAVERAVRRVGVVANPASPGFDQERRRELLRALDAAGAEAVVEETTERDPGQEATRRALARDVDVLMVAGGDGTVMACVSSLAGTGVPLAVLPAGTGNLLAVNLDLPGDPEGAIEVALHGRRRCIDVGAIGPDRFAVMSGIGFDAAMLAGADPALKRRIGALAYVLSGLRQVTRPPTEFRISLDDLPPISRTGQGVLIGNLGKLQGGLAVLPDARPDDGLLDVGVLETRSLGGWPRLAGRVLLGRAGRLGEPPLELFRARRVEIECRRPQPTERDGEPGPRARQLVVEVRPGALTLCVPPADEDPTDGRPS
jgi:diacylglycerol kinase family enzyme